MWMHFKSLQKFMNLKVRKLEGMRKVEEHLQVKYRQRVLNSLRANQHKAHTKETNLRKACQFRLFRYPALLKAQTLNTLRYFPRHQREMKELQAQKVKAFRQKRVLELMKKSIQEIRFDHESQNMKLKYY